MSDDLNKELDLNQAAELVRTSGEELFAYTHSLQFANAAELLHNTMLSWLDPTPITIVWLLANGWSRGIEMFWLTPPGCSTKCSILQHHGDDWLFDDMCDWSLLIKTVGQLRMIIHLKGTAK